MRTETLSVTYASLQELRDALRPAFQTHGLNIDDFFFELREDVLLRVASTYVLDDQGSREWSLSGIIGEDLVYLQKRRLLSFMISRYIAELTDRRECGDKAWPKTDYIITE